MWNVETGKGGKVNRSGRKGVSGMLKGRKRVINNHPSLKILKQTGRCDLFGKFRSQPAEAGNQEVLN